MNTQNNRNSSSSASLQLASLEKEYNVTLSQYNQVYQEYISTLNGGDKYSRFLQTKGSNYLSSAPPLKSAYLKTADECQSLCQATSSCSGATFYSNKNSCVLVQGEGIVSRGLETDVAIYPVVKKYYSRLNGLNSKLTDINHQMMDIINANYSHYEDDKYNTQELKSKLLHNYDTLTIERNKVNAVFDEYERYLEQINVGRNEVHKNYTNYFILSMIVLFIIYIFLQIALK
jgi:hypothetical protein